MDRPRQVKRLVLQRQCVYGWVGVSVMWMCVELKESELIKDSKGKEVKKRVGK